VDILKTLLDSGFINKIILARTINGICLNADEKPA
jgi:hypothetical protein